MESTHRELLRSNRRDICLVDFSAPTVAEKLFDLKIFTENDKNNVSTEEKDLRQKEKLLDILVKRGPKAFQAFLDICKEMSIIKLYEILGGDLTEINKNEIQEDIPMPSQPGSLFVCFYLNFVHVYIFFTVNREVLAI